MKKFTPFIFIVLIVSSFLFYKCSSSEQSAQIRKPIGEDIPPGSAIVVCTMNSFAESGDVYLIDVNVKSVLGYGSATEEIAPNAGMKLQMAKRLIELKSLKKGTEFQVEIKQPKMKMESEQNSVWTVSQLMK
ncbi:MAG: hypothetical protein NTZ27_12645 [Ignavibacteriales bacterium]|nr:hypothetical protein [Ignavibacteriales bacterium]